MVSDVPLLGGISGAFFFSWPAACGPAKRTVNRNKPEHRPALSAMCLMKYLRSICERSERQSNTASRTTKEKNAEKAGIRFWKSSKMASKAQPYAAAKDHNHECSR